MVRTVLRRYKEAALHKPSDELGAEPLDLSLPLPEISESYGRRITGDSDDESGAEESYYRDYVASQGGVVKMRNRTGPTQLISWRLVQKGTLIELEPVDIRAGTSTRAVPFRKIRIKSPTRVRPHCVATSESDDGKLVIDFIVSTGFLYTVVLPLDEFVANTPTRLTSRNGAHWRSIKSPYSFDLKKPVLLHAVSSRFLVTPIADGSVVKFERLENPLGEMVTTVLDDPHSGLSFSRLFPLVWNSGGSRVPGKPDLSVRAGMSVSSDPSTGHLVVLGVNRRVRIWNIITGQFLLETDLDSQDSSADSRAMLLPDVCSFVHLSGEYLLTYIPSREEAGIFKVWRLTDGKVQDLGPDFEIEAVTPDSSAVWLLGDLSMRILNSRISVWALWKSDTNSVVHSTTIGEGYRRVWFSSSPSPRNVHMHDEKNFLTSIFGADGFSSRTIRTALPIYEEHYGSGQQQQQNAMELDNLTMSELRQKVSEVVGSAVTLEMTAQGPDFNGYRSDLSTQCMRFYRLCCELEKQGSEALAMHVDDDTTDGSVIVVKSSYLTALRNSTSIELLYLNRSSRPSKELVNEVSILTNHEIETADSILRLLDILYEFRQSLSHNLQHELFGALEEDFSTTNTFMTMEREVNLYETFIAAHLTESSLGTLVTALYDIPELDSVLQELLDTIRRGGSGVVEAPPGYLTPYGSQLISKGAHEFGQIAKHVVFDVLTVVLMSSCHEDLVSEHTTAYAQFSSLFKSLCSLLYLTSVGALTKRGQDDNDEDVDNSFRYALSFFEQIVLGTKLAHQGEIWSRLSSQDAVAESAVELYLKGYRYHVEEYMATYSPRDEYATFIQGMLLLPGDQEHRALTLLKKASVGMASQKLTKNRADILSRVDKELFRSGGGLDSNLWKYYLVMSEYAFAVGAESSALELAKLSTENSAFTTDAEKTDMYLKVAKYATARQFFDDAYAAVVELHMISPETSQQPLEEFVDAMAQSGNGRRLCEYPFIGFADYVTDYLNRMAKQYQSQSDVASIEYYKILYGWNVERGDYQAAAGCLYNQLLVLKDRAPIDFPVSDHLKIVELYMTVLNSLSAIPFKDDRWLLAETADSRTALSYEDIYKEYNDFVFNRMTSLLNQGPLPQLQE